MELNLEASWLVIRKYCLKICESWVKNEQNIPNALLPLLFGINEKVQQDYKTMFENVL